MSLAGTMQNMYYMWKGPVKTVPYPQGLCLEEEFTTTTENPFQSFDPVNPLDSGEAEFPTTNVLLLAVARRSSHH